jgi:hypothetical protein
VFCVMLSYLDHMEGFPVLGSYSTSTYSGIILLFVVSTVISYTLYSTQQDA